jgi:outer membrane protein OmpA-like peptidoglycan-associated protein
VRDYLVARGIAPDRIIEVGYGEKVLACRGASAPCWQKNRRADFLVKSTDKQSP